MYKMMKVFDCQDMSSATRLKFFEMTEQGNDCYVSWWPTLPQYQEDDGTWADNEDYTDVDNWLLAHGAEPDEEVLVKHSW